ncbi:MAG: copper homeostasis protein CutC [Pseudomonadota bacterium]
MALLEICVDTIEGAEAALAGGADRVELCSSLSEGGLTPSAGLMHAAAALPIPCYAMICPRCGLFDFCDAETNIMLRDVTEAREAGLAGVVLGVQRADGALHEAVLAKLIQEAGEMGKTLHRVIDVVPSPLDGLETAMALGFDRVLTSGAEPFAPEGVPLIQQMVRRSEDRISIMPGCGLAPENVQEVIAQTGVHEVHAACTVKAEGDPAFSDFAPPNGRFITSADEVAKMRGACCS